MGCVFLEDEDEVLPDYYWKLQYMDVMYMCTWQTFADGMFILILLLATCLEMRP